MIGSTLDALFGCSHSRTSFPLTPKRSAGADATARRGTYVTCLNCGKEFAYNWKEMRIEGPTAMSANKADSSPVLPRLLRFGSRLANKFQNPLPKHLS